MSLADFISELDQEDAQKRALGQQAGPVPAPAVSGDGVAGGSPAEPATIPVPAASPAPGGVDGGAASPAPKAPAEEPTSWGKRFLGLLGGAVRSPFQAAGATTDLFGDVARTGVASATQFASALPSTTPMLAMGYAFNGHAADFLSMKNSAGKIGDPTWNEAATQILSLAIGGAGLESGAGRGARALAGTVENAAGRFLARTGVTAGEAGATSAAFMDPEQERLSNYLHQLGLHDAFTDYLQHDDGEGRAEGRFKNAVEGMLTGVAADQLFRVGKYWVKSLKGDTAAADGIASEIASEHPPVDEAAAPKIEEVSPSEAASLAAPPKAPSSPEVINWVQAEDGSLVSRPAPIEGSPETTTGGTNETGGDTGAAAKAGTEGEAPGGQAPAADTPEPIIFKLSPGEGQPERIIGQTTAEDLKALGEDISTWKAMKDVAGDPAVDVTPELHGIQAERAGNFKLSPLGGPDNVAPLLRAFIDRLPEDTLGTRSDADLMGFAKQISGSIGEDANAVVEAGRLIAGKLTDADVAMATLRSIWTRAGKDIDEMNFPGVDWLNASDEDFTKAATAVHNMTTLSSYVQSAKQALGRGLRVNQLPDADTYLATLARNEGDVPPMPSGEMSPLPRSREELKDWMDLWKSTAGDPSLRAKLLQNLVSVPTPGLYLRSSFANLFTANILSGPKTILLHLIGPSILNTTRAVERLSGAAAASLNPLLSTEERQAARMTAKATVPAFFQNLTDIGSVFSQAYRSALQGDSTLGGSSYFDTATRMGPLTENLLKAAGTEPDWKYSLGNLINVWPRQLSRVLTGLNEFSKRVVYQGDVRVNAMVEASQKGLTGDEAHAFIQDRVAGSLDEVGRATNESLLRTAEQTTLTSSPGADGSWTRSFANGLTQMRQDIPEMRYLVPVFNVPANAIGGTLRRLPIAFMPGFGRLFPETADALAGKMGPVAQAEAHGRFMTGAAFLAGGVLLNRAGLLTGAGPQDPTDRKVWLMEHQPYSIRIGDNWVSYDRLEILGGLLSIPATLSDATTHHAQDQAVGDMMWSGAGALGEWFRDRAALQNASALLGAGSDPVNTLGGFANKFAGNVISGLLMPRAITAMVTAQMDPIARMKNNWLDYLKAATPGLSKTLEPVRNVLGEPVNRSADSFTDNLFPTVIAPAVTFKQDAVVDELDRLYQATGYGAGADAHNIGYGFFNPKAVALEDGRSLYDHFMQARQVMPVNGYTLRQTLDGLFNSPEYAHAVDADPGQQRTSLGDLSRGYMVKHVYDTFNETIKAELAASSGRANSYLVAAAAKQRDDAYLHDVSADALVGNPDLYRARGINQDAYSAKLQAGASGALLNALQGK